MNEQIVDGNDEETLTFEVSDEGLEAAAGPGHGPAAFTYRGGCPTYDLCTYKMPGNSC